MVRLIALGFCLLITVPQDPVDPVKALIERLGSDDLEIRAAAQKELAIAGRPTLPALGKALASASGEQKQRLQSVIEHITAFGTPPLVTLESRDRPLREIAKDLERQTGIPVRIEGAIAEIKVSVSVNRTPIWKVVEDFCRARGDLMYRFADDSVGIFPSKFRSLPSSDSGGLRFIIDGFTWTRHATPPGGGQFAMRSAVLTPRGARVTWMQVKVDELKDDKGRELTTVHEMEPRPDGDRYGLDSRRIVFPQTYRPPRGSPSMEATKLSRCRGKALVFLAGGERVLGRVKDPLSVPSSPAPEGLPTFGLDRWSLRDGYLGLDFTAGWEAESVKLLPYKMAPMIVLRLKNGEWIPTNSEHYFHPGPDAMTRRSNSIWAEYPEGAEIASLDLIVPDPVIKIEIPFDFRDIPLKQDELAPIRPPADLAPDGDPAAMARALSDLVDLSETRPGDVEREARLLPAYYREVLESELKMKRELGSLFGRASRIKLQGKGRTFADYLADLDKLPGWDFYPGIGDPSQGRYDLDVESWPIEAATRLAEAARMRFYPYEWSRSTILAHSTGHEPPAAPGSRPWYFYRNFAVQAMSGAWGKQVDFSGRPTWNVGVGFQVLTDPGIPAVGCANLRVIETLDQNGRPIPEVASNETALPVNKWESTWNPPMYVSLGLAAEGLTKISRLRVSFVVRIPSEVRRYVVTEFDASKPRKFSDEYFDVEVGMQEGASSGGDCVYARVVPKKLRHADLFGIPIQLFQKLDQHGCGYPDAKGGAFTGRGDGTTVTSSWCTLRTADKVDPNVVKGFMAIRRPVRMEVAIPVGIKERVVYAEFRDIPLK